MGRLFWKFFLSFWLALLLAGVGVGTAVWLRHQTETGEDKTSGARREAIDDRHIASDDLADDGFADHPPPPPNPCDEEFPGLTGSYAHPPPFQHPHDKHFHPNPPPSPLLPILSGVFASLMFSFALAWYFAKPIRRLRYAIASLAQGNLEVRVAESMGKRRDELADLGQEFDHMAEQIYRLVHAQQRLLHDVSHELRSPLARIQAAIGLAQQQPEKLQNTLARIERESQRISDLVGELLVLSRLETGVSGSDRHDFDIGCLLEDIVADVRFEAEQRQVLIHAEGIRETQVNGWGELLHRAIENVLRNAVQHCKKDGVVQVAADFDIDRQLWRLRVDDQGPGVAENDLAAIFEPFFRSGKTVKPNSVGLGLAIASRSIVAHGGEIKASNHPQGGLRIDIEIPFSE